MVYWFDYVGIAMVTRGKTYVHEGYRRRNSETFFSYFEHWDVVERTHRRWVLFTEFFKELPVVVVEQVIIYRAKTLFLLALYVAISDERLPSREFADWPSENGGGDSRL
jgi:hypothetical protein